MSRNRALSVLGVAMVVALPIVLQITGAALPRWARFGVLEVWAIVVCSLFVLIASEKLRQLRDRPHPFTLKSIMLIALIGALIGAVVAPIVWAIVPADEAASTSTGNASASGIADPSDPDLKGPQTPLRGDQQNQAAPPPSRLVPGNGEMPPGLHVAQDYIVVRLGGFDLTIDSLPFTPLAQGNEDMIVLDGADEGLLISGKFFNKAGKIVCEIVKNEIHINDDNVFRKEQSAHRLKIVNDEARTVIDVEYVNSRFIRMLGDFYLREGFNVLITSESAKFGTNSIEGPLHILAKPASGIVGVWIDKPDNSTRAAGFVLNNKKGETTKSKE